MTTEVEASSATHDPKGASALQLRGLRLATVACGAMVALISKDNPIAAVVACGVWLMMISALLSHSRWSTPVLGVGLLTFAAGFFSLLF